MSFIIDYELVALNSPSCSSEVLLCWPVIVTTGHTVWYYWSDHNLDPATVVVFLQFLLPLMAPVSVTSSIVPNH